MPVRPKADGTISVDWKKIRRRARNLLCRWSRSANSSGPGLRLVTGHDVRGPEKPAKGLPGKFPGSELFLTKSRTCGRGLGRRSTVKPGSESALPVVKLAVG